MLIRGAVKGLVKVAQQSKAFASGRTTIEKYVPYPYQKPALKIFRAFEQALTGATIFSIYDEITSQNAVPPKNGKFPQTRKFSKAYSRSKYAYRRSNKYGYSKTRRRCRHIQPCRC